MLLCFYKRLAIFYKDYILVQCPRVSEMYCYKLEHSITQINKVLLVEETRVPGENHQPVSSH
jgi:hypothetical protein